MIWESAWKVGAGDSQLTETDLDAIQTTVLQRLYEDPKFVPSVDLDRHNSQETSPRLELDTVRDMLGRRTRVTNG
jgi:hypothetical protein